ncbi:MAG TPA: glycosyltransferase family 4 protein [Candidatus Krumholzibacteria bacterium]|nr:glycosyltransferase family 4 protein [Candidatus Krumholzibacteria bacterium]
MRISFVEPHLELYGGIRRILEFSNRFVERGETVTIYHPAGTACTWMECRAAVRPLRALHDDAHDVLIFNNPPDYPHVRRARARAKVFYILELYDRDKLLRFDPKIFWPRKGRMLSLKRTLQMPFVMVANASWIQEWLREHMRIESELQLGGLNRELFHPVERARIQDGVFRVLCSGDRREHKGTASIIGAIERLPRGRPVELETYHGKGIPQSGMAAVYARADLFVDAQWHAGWNNPVIEAMACGTPVVCTDIGGVRDFAFHERTALLVPPRDPGALASAIARMIDDAALRERLAANALAEVKRFDWDRAANEFLDKLYRYAGQARVTAHTS